MQSYDIIVTVVHLFYRFCSFFCSAGKVLICTRALTLPCQSEFMFIENVVLHTTVLVLERRIFNFISTSNSFADNKFVDVRKSFTTFHIVSNYSSAINMDYEQSLTRSSHVLSSSNWITIIWCPIRSLTSRIQRHHRYCEFYRDSVNSKSG